MVEDWQKIHQPYELAYHKNVGLDWCNDDKQFNEFWITIFDWIGYGEPKNILDIGSGPRPPLKTLYTNEPFTVIEPLGEEYKKMAKKEWWDNIMLYSQPAEIFIPELEGKMDFILCWNCLDHTYDYKQILTNVEKYLTRNGRFVLAVDLKPPRKGHPGFNQEEFESMIKMYFNVVKVQGSFQERDLCLILKKKYQ